MVRLSQIEGDLNVAIAVFVLGCRPRRVSALDAARAWPCQSIRQLRESIKIEPQFWGLTACRLFILQCSNYLLSVTLERTLVKELPVSLANNIEFLRHLPKLNGIYGFGDFERNLRPGQRSPLVETTGFGPNPGNLRMFSFVPHNLQPAPGLVVVLHGCGQTAAALTLSAPDV